MTYRRQSLNSQSINQSLSVHIHPDPVSEMSNDSDPESGMALLDIDEEGEDEQRIDATSRHVSEAPEMPDVPATTTVPVSDEDDEDDEHEDHQGPTRSEAESDLSDIDEAQFENFDPANVAIDERTAGAVGVDLDESNIGLIGVHKRKRLDAEESGGKTKKKRQQQQRERKQEKPNKRLRTRKDDGGDDGDGDFIQTEEVMGKRTRKARELTSDHREIPRKRKQTDKDGEIDDEQLSPEERKWFSHPSSRWIPFYSSDADPANLLSPFRSTKSARSTSR